MSSLRVVLMPVLAAIAAFSLVPARAANDPAVTLVVHIVLDVPQALVPRPDSYCFGEWRPSRSTPIPQRLVDEYETTLRSLGPLTDNVDLGTWTVGEKNSSEVAFIPTDHVVVRTHLSAVRRTLPQLLRRMRVQLHQQEMLAEIFGGTYPQLGQPRTRVEVLLPRGASYDRIAAVNRIFGNDGHGGASQHTDTGGLHVYSGLTARDAPKIEARLRSAGFAYTTEPETFITVDAPRCERIPR